MQDQVVDKYWKYWGKPDHIQVFQIYIQVHSQRRGRGGCLSINGGHSPQSAANALKPNGQAFPNIMLLLWYWTYYSSLLVVTMIVSAAGISVSHIGNKSGTICTTRSAHHVHVYIMYLMQKLRIAMILLYYILYILYKLRTPYSVTTGFITSNVYSMEECVTHHMKWQPEKTTYRLGRRPGYQGPHLLFTHQVRGVKCTTGVPNKKIRARSNAIIGSWNVRILKNTGTLEELEHELTRYKWNILGLCE